MRTLAKGKSKKAIFKLLRVLINTSQDNYEGHEADHVKEIADVIEVESPTLGMSFALKGNILMTDDAAQKRSDKYAGLGAVEVSPSPTSPSMSPDSSTTPKKVKLASQDEETKQ